MPRIPYPDLDSITDPEMLAALDRSRRVGTPRPESAAVRGLGPVDDPAGWPERLCNTHAKKHLRQHGPRSHGPPQSQKNP